MQSRSLRVLVGVLISSACAPGLQSAASAASPAAPRYFSSGGLYSADSGNTDCNGITQPNYNPVPALWRFDPLVNNLPSSRAQITYQWQNAAASAVPPTGYRAFYATDDAAPAVGGYPGEAQDIANTLSWFASQHYLLQYAFADFESNGRAGNWANLFSLVNQVRTSPAGGARAFVGNYDFFPGPLLLSADYPFFADNRTVNGQYPTPATNGMAGVNVAMPVGYQMQAYSFHAVDPTWGANWWANTGFSASDLIALQADLTYNQKAAIGSPYFSPNERAGLFYGPLEFVSVAARNLPQGHELIPWVSQFQAQDPAQVPALLPGQAPTQADGEALLEHDRLRGADGYYAFGVYLGYCNNGESQTLSYSDGSTFVVASYNSYLADMHATWSSMDWFFSLPTRVGKVSAHRPLNFFTFKNTGGSYVDPNGLNGGIEWSGFQIGNRVLAVVSNLGNGSQAATGGGSGTSGNWQSVFASLGANLPQQSPTVPAGNHLVVQYLTNAPLATFTGYALGTKLGGAQGWRLSRPGAFVVGSPAGAGATHPSVVTVAKPAAAWLSDMSTANPGGIGATANDAMLYSFEVFTGWSGSGSASFGPAVSAGSTAPLPAQNSGPTVWVVTGGPASYWAFDSSLAGAGRYQSTNFTPAPNAWYAVAMTVDPSSSLSSVYAKNLTAGDTSWTALQFIDTQNPTGPELTSLPSGLVPGVETPTLYNAFQLTGSSGTQFDSLAAQLYPFPVSPASSYVPALP